MNLIIVSFLLVSERSKHMVDVAKLYDFTNTDG